MKKKCFEEIIQLNNILNKLTRITMVESFFMTIYRNTRRKNEKNQKEKGGYLRFIIKNEKKILSMEEE